MELTLPPRENLGVFPTPLIKMPELAGVLGIEHLWAKRDDLSGFSWGGNKVRAAEYLIGSSLASGVTDLVVAGGPTSNFAVIMASAGRRCGIDVHQVAYGNEPESVPATLLASRAAGASIVFTGNDDRSEMETRATDLAERLKAEGRRPLVVPRGGATPVGSVGFFAAAIELSDQLQEHGLNDVTVVLPVGSAGSIAGLIAGQAHLGATWRVIGASVSRPVDEIQDILAAKASAVCELIGIESGDELKTAVSNVELVDCRGDGFGVTSMGEDTLRNDVSQATGLLIDPSYNAKALLWLASSNISTGTPIVYWLTGGALNALP